MLGGVVLAADLSPDVLLLAHRLIYSINHTHSLEVDMVELSSLWLPILLSAVIVFVVSSIIHMVSPWHRSDYPKMANEEKVMDAWFPVHRVGRKCVRPNLLRR